jgi:hypothetical protein
VANETVIHLGDAGIGGLACHVKPKERRHPEYGLLWKNWTWKPEEVTCKRCKKVLADRRRMR